MIRLHPANDSAAQVILQPALAAAMGVQAEPAVLAPILRDSLIEDGDADAGVAIRVTEVGRYEFVRWSRDTTEVVLSTADERAAAMAFVDSLCPLDRLVAAIGEPQGFSLVPSEEGFHLAGQGGCEVDFPRSSATFLTCVRIMNLIAAADDVVVRCIEQHWSAPIFGALDDVLRAVRQVLPGGDAHSYGAWRTWWETTGRHGAEQSV